jgi:hypothetical protein
MKTQLQNEIRELMKDLAQNGIYLKLMAKSPRETERLLCVRTEIYKSICHRQFKLLKEYEIELTYGKAVA